jgi:hypothetical protein
MKPKIISIFFLLVALLLPSIIAGCRDLSIGTDTSGYVERHFDAAQSSATYMLFLSEYTDSRSWLEPLYGLLTYVVASHTTNIAWFLFSIQFIIVSLVYLSASKLRNYAPVCFSMFIYFMFFFNESLNLARQYMAQSFCLLSFTFLLERKILKSFFVFLPALGFHITAFIYLAVYPIFYFTNRNSVRIIRIYKILGLLASVIILTCLEYIIDFIVSNGMIGSKFYQYVSGDDASFPVAIFTCSMVLFMILHYANRWEIDKIKYYFFFEYITLLCILLSPIGMINVTAIRCIDYFLFLSIVFLPMLLYNYQNIRISYKNIFPFIICFMLFYWYMTFGVANIARTIPYTSKMLGIY